MDDFIDAHVSANGEVHLNLPSVFANQDMRFYLPPNNDDNALAHSIYSKVIYPREAITKMLEETMGSITDPTFERPAQHELEPAPEFE